MTLRAAVTQYVAFRKSPGERFSVNEQLLTTHTAATHLRRADVDIDTIRA